MDDILRQFLSHVKKNWAVFRSAPIAFLITIVLAVLIIWVGSWGLLGIYQKIKTDIHNDFKQAYEERVQNKDIQIQTVKERILIKDDQLNLLKERIKAKDDLLDEYRERLQLTSKSSTTFSTMSNKELRDKALGVVSGIRDYIEKVENEDNRLYYLEDQERQLAKTEAERHQVWVKFRNKSMQQHSEQRLYYTRTFSTDTILLRDEIITRLPKESKNNDAFRFYEHTTNRLGMTFIANDLERMAKSLP